MRTTPATRTFTADPVPDEVLFEILDDARFAPNGGNRQAWHAIVVRDAAAKQRIAELYELGMREYAAHLQAGLVPFVASEVLERNRWGEPYRAAVDLDAARQMPVPNGYPQYMADAPVLLVVTIDLSSVPAVDSGLDRFEHLRRRFDLPVRSQHPACREGARLRRPHHVVVGQAGASTAGLAAHPARARPSDDAADRPAGA